MKLSDLVLRSRSYRSFVPGAAVSEDALLSFVDTARYCPSSVNLQPLKYRLVTDRDECAALLSKLRFAGLLDIHLPPEGHEPTAYIVICHDNAVTDNVTRFDRDVGIVAQTIMLTAAEAGYGGCMVGAFDPDGVCSVLGLRAGLTPRLVLAVGIPDETVLITEPDGEASMRYYRANELHCVPKRSLEDIVIK